MSHKFPIRLLPALAMCYATSCKHSVTHTASSDDNTPAYFATGLTTGMASTGVYRKVPVDQAISVMPATRVLSPTMGNLHGIYYCRHVGSDPGGKGQHSGLIVNDLAQGKNGLSTGTTLMSPNGVKVDERNEVFPVFDQGNYGMFPDPSNADFDVVNFFGSSEGFQLSFLDATHVKLFPNFSFNLTNPLASIKPSTAATGYTMEWTHNSMFGDFWLRHSSGQPDYNLIPITSADGTPNANYFDYFLPDMASAGITVLDVVVNGDSELAKPGSAITVPHITVADRAKYVKNEVSRSATAVAPATIEGAASENGDNAVATE